MLIKPFEHIYPNDVKLSRIFSDPLKQSQSRVTSALQDKAFWLVKICHVTGNIQWDCLVWEWSNEKLWPSKISVYDFFFVQFLITPLFIATWWVLL